MFRTIFVAAAVCVSAVDSDEAGILSGEQELENLKKEIVLNTIINFLEEKQRDNIFPCSDRSIIIITQLYRC